ncbi:ATP-binding protein [Streptomyces sp. NPDC046805]|uniref:ATP-binding protein n=1 Tax=Streptomyces sp. NPDC046805 TaxID=3155134 RepID=UPI0033DA17FF
MTALIWALAVVAVAAAAPAVRYRQKWQQERRRADRLHEHATTLAEQMGFVERQLEHVTQTVVPAAANEARSGRAYRPRPTGVPQLAGTSIVGVLDALAPQVCSAIVQTAQYTEAKAQEQLAQAQAESEERVSHARQEAVDVARAAVRAFGSSLVARAEKLSTRISAGVRLHVGDPAYETLVEVDHLAQQMLLTASGYVVLAGGKLSKRHPATPLTDVVRAAMGRVVGYERVQHPEMSGIAVEGRAVEAVVHTLALLLDNALRYSPPNARVHVSLEHGSNCVFLNVDDAGLRMEEERLTWARRVMTTSERDDITRLGAYPQTGLRVAAVLAASYGYRVEVTSPNIYGGNRAFIVLPKELLTTQPPSNTVTTAKRQQPKPRPQTADTTTSSGLTVRRPAAAAPRPAAAPQQVEPGRPEPAVAWLEGTRRGRESSTTPRETEGH